MTISVINYRLGKVQIFKNCPNEWGNNEFEKFLYKTLKFIPNEIVYMDTDDIDIVKVYSSKEISTTIN